jgi:selenide,water dikinase
LRRAVERQLSALGVSLHCKHRVERVSRDALHFEHGDTANFDTLIWSTGAAAAPWIAQSGLAVDERGFMRVEDTLQSSSHPQVFGAGDIATQHRHPRPKAGVYAVRQGPVLAANLAAMAEGSALKEHQPQTGFLSILSLGPQRAVAERNGLSVSGDWVWRWKDRIDRRFMQRFSELPPRQMPARRADAGVQAPCGGCGAKIGADALGEVLAELRRKYPQHTPEALSLDDAALLDAPMPVLQSLDALRALIDDPWRMGRIAAQHALSDLYASGARPHSALALVTLPFASAALQRRDLLQVLDGALSILAAADCRLLGGHSMQGPEFQLAFAVNGVLDAEPVLAKRGASIGDALLLSKPLGSGALFALQMQARADGRDIDVALTMMERSNRDAADIARAHGATALTDVTGFGLAGHALEMLDNAQAVRLHLNALPVLSGALDAMRQGVFSTLHASNRAAVIDRCRLPGDAPVAAQLLFDPQTSGGLLMAVPAAAAGAALSALAAAGDKAARVGEIVEARDGIALELLIADQKLANPVLVAAAHLELRTTLQMQQILAIIERLGAGDQFVVDDCRAVHAQKNRRVEHTLELFHGDAHDVGLAGGVDAHVVAGGINPLDLRDPDKLDIAAILDRDFSGQLSPLLCSPSARASTPAALSPVMLMISLTSFSLPTELSSCSRCCMARCTASCSRSSSTGLST